MQQCMTLALETVDLHSTFSVGMIALQHRDLFHSLLPWAKWHAIYCFPLLQFSVLALFSYSCEWEFGSLPCAHFCHIQPFNIMFGSTPNSLFLNSCFQGIQILSPRRPLINHFKGTFILAYYFESQSVVDCLHCCWLVATSFLKDMLEQREKEQEEGSWDKIDSSKACPVTCE